VQQVLAVPATQHGVVAATIMCHPAKPLFMRLSGNREERRAGWWHASDGDHRVVPRACVQVIGVLVEQA